MGKKHTFVGRKLKPRIRNDDWRLSQGGSGHNYSRAVMASLWREELRPWLILKDELGFCLGRNFRELSGVWWPSVP